MSRRRIVILLVLAALVGAAFTPWTVTSDRVRFALARQIRNEFGGSFSIAGPTTLTLLPLPQLTLQRVRYESEGQLLEVEAAELTAELRLVALLKGQLRLKQLSLTTGLIQANLADDGPTGWDDALAELRRRLSSGAQWANRIDRLVLKGSTIAIVDRSGRHRSEIRKVDLLMRWPDPTGDVDVWANGDWNGERVSLTVSEASPSALIAGKPDTIELSLQTRQHRLEAIGSVTWAEHLRFAGTISAKTESIAAFSRWSGLAGDLRDVARPATLAGDATVSPDKIEWPRATLDIGRDRLEGTIALQAAGARPVVRATMAANDLDLGWVGHLLDPPGTDRLGADYDIRLSASGLQLGSVKLKEVATSVQIGARAMEISLGRAGFAGGSLRGRITSVLDGEGRDMKGQIAVESVDLERALGELGPLRGLSGLASGQANVEITGDRTGDLANQLRGRATLSARDGEIAGASLAEVPRRAGSSAGPAEWKSGRARFAKGNLVIELNHGLAELTDGALDIPGWQTQLRGHVALQKGVAALRATTRPVPPTSAPPLVMDLNGPLTRLTATASAEAGSASP